MTAQGGAAQAGPVCAHCRTPLPARGTGRPAKYCSSPCRVAAHRERREDERAAAQLATRDQALDQAYDAVLAAARAALQVAREDADPRSDALLVGLFRARKAMTDFSDAAMALRDARLAAERLGHGDGA